MCICLSQCIVLLSPPCPSPAAMATQAVPVAAVPHAVCTDEVQTGEAFGWKIEVEEDKLLAQPVGKFEAISTLTIQHVKGHAGVTGNESVDKAAGVALTVNHSDVDSAFLRWKW